MGVFQESLLQIRKAPPELLTNVFFTDDAVSKKSNNWKFAVLCRVFGDFFMLIGWVCSNAAEPSDAHRIRTQLRGMPINYGIVYATRMQIVGEAIDLSLLDLLGLNYTDEVRSAWKSSFDYTSSMWKALQSSESITVHDEQASEDVCSFTVPIVDCTRAEDVQRLEANRSVHNEPRMKLPSRRKIIRTRFGLLARQG